MKTWSLVLAGLLAGGVAGTFVTGSLLKGQAQNQPRAQAAVFPRELTSYRDVVKKVLASAPDS
jgi:hypothetical protein